MAHVRQSWPDSGRGLQVEFPRTFGGAQPLQGEGLRVREQVAAGCFPLRTRLKPNLQNLNASPHICPVQTSTAMDEVIEAQARLNKSREWNLPNQKWDLC